MDLPNWPAPVAACCGTLRRAGHEACPVGGCVRDLLLGRAPGDWDIATSARPEAVTALFERTVPTGLKHGTVTVLLGGMALEVTTFRGESGYSDGRHPDRVTFGVGLREDLARRDFTINAMALAPDGSVLDPFGGRADLARRLIRCVGEPERRFTEDALRMLRAVRFAAQLGFSLEARTAAALASCAPLLERVSGERIRAELEKTLLSPHPSLGRPAGGAGNAGALRGPRPAGGAVGSGGPARHARPPLGRLLCRHGAGHYPAAGGAGSAPGGTPSGGPGAGRLGRHRPGSVRPGPAGRGHRPGPLGPAGARAGPPGGQPAGVPALLGKRTDLTSVRSVLLPPFSEKTR